VIQTKKLLKLVVFSCLHTYQRHEHELTDETNDWTNRPGHNTPNDGQINRSTDDYAEYDDYSNHQEGKDNVNDGFLSAYVDW
jgi:hypothetical protein